MKHMATIDLNKNNMLRIALTLFVLVANSQKPKSFINDQIPIKRVEFQDSILSAIIDDYLISEGLVPDSSDYIMLFIDPMSYLFCKEFEIEGGSDEKDFVFPINKNEHEIYRIGITLTPDSTTTLPNLAQNYKSTVLNRNKGIDVLIVSQYLTFDIEMHQDFYTCRRTKVGAGLKPLGVYEYEVGSAVFKISKELIFGKEY